MEVALSHSFSIMSIYTPSEHLFRELSVRKDRIFSSEVEHVVYELKAFLNFIKSDPILYALLHELDHDKPDFNQEIARMQSLNHLTLPDAELDRIKLSLVFLEHCINSNEVIEHVNLSFNLGFRRKSMNEVSSFFLKQFFLPFFDYIVTNINKQKIVLFLLQKYKVRIEWYKRTRANLFKIFNEEVLKGKGEEFLDENLRQYLFDQGIGYPFSQPHSPSGIADIIAGLDTSDPLVLEIKVFDSKIYHKQYIKKGFDQVRRYASDYNKPIGYLVVFNISDKELLLDFGTSGEYPYLEADNKRIYIITVDLYPDRKSASKKAGRIVLTKNDLMRDHP